MAKMTAPFAFTGSIDSLSFYKRRDIDEILVRRKGGPSKKMIKDSPKFAVTHRINTEFGGRAAASSHIMQTLWQLKTLGDYNIAGPINAMLKPIQALDITSEYGQRSVCLSKNPGLLKGFSLNKKNGFDSIVRCPLQYSLLRDELTASVDIPALLPGFNFFAPPYPYPQYCFVISCGIIPDLFHTQHGYHPAIGYANFSSAAASTPWYPVMKGSPEVSLQLDLKRQQMTLPGSAFSIMLSVGISFGNIVENNQAVPVKYAGGAKVLEVV